MKEVVQACRNNFQGKEELRQRFIRRAPKFGNDDAYVDFLAKEVYFKVNEEAMKQIDYRGYPCTMQGSVAAAHFGTGLLTGATPDGRLACQPFADGTVSPMAGMDTLGPTATLNSASKMDPLLSGSHLFNQRFIPQFLEGENKKLFAAYIKTWSDLGIWHIQFNVVNHETLKQAQLHPESYTDLIIRVAGYSAYFTDLSKQVQDDIIMRTEQAF